MKRIDINNHVVELFDSAETLPIKRYQRFQKYLMIDNEVGSSFEDFDKRTGKAIEFLKKDMKHDAIVELENRRQAVFNSFQDYSPKNLALGILVYSIDGEVYPDFSEETLQRIIDKLDEIGFNKIQLESEVEEVKKKSKPRFLLTLKEALIKVWKLKIMVLFSKGSKNKLNQ